MHQRALPALVRRISSFFALAWSGLPGMHGQDVALGRASWDVLELLVP